METTSLNIKVIENEVEIDKHEHSRLHQNTPSAILETIIMIMIIIIMVIVVVSCHDPYIFDA